MSETTAATATLALEPEEQTFAGSASRRALRMTGAGRGARASGGILRGREPELAVIGEFLTHTVRGQGGVLIVEGPPGIGKSRLLAEARAMATRLGVRPLFGEAFESQQALPFAPLLAATQESDPAIGQFELVRSLGGQPDLRYWMLHDLHAALESAALKSPLALVLDDLQWADAGTLAALSALPSRLAGTPILWILAMRAPQGRPALDDAIARLEQDGALLLPVGVLTEQAVAEVVADKLDAEADPALLELAADARGNPFLLVELLEGLQEEGRLHRDKGRAVLLGDGLPIRLTDSMRARLDRLSEDAGQVVRVAAVLGQRFMVEQLALMLQRRASTLIPALDELLRADLLAETTDWMSFRHDLLRQATLETLPRSMRRALGREAATVRLESGATPVEVALQLADSAEVGDHEAIGWLREAARTLAGSDAPTAANLSVRALELMPPHDEGRGPLVAETVLLLQSAMRPDDARALGQSAFTAVLSTDQEAQVRLSLSAMCMRSTAARAEENRRALALPGLTPVMRARHLGWLTHNLATNGQQREAGSVAESAMASAQQTGDLQARVMTTLGLTCIDCARGGFLCALERIEELQRTMGSAERAPYAQVLGFHHANLLADLGRVDEALSLKTEGVAIGQRERSAWLLETWAQYGSLLRLAVGQLADALAEAESCATVVDEVAAGYSAGLRSMTTRAQVAVHTGDARQLKATVEAARQVVDCSSPVVRRGAAWIMALAAIERHDPADALRWLHDDGMASAAPFLPGDGGHLPAVARIALMAGDREFARQIAEIAESFDRESPGVPLISASAAQTRGLVEGDSAALVDAAQLLRGTQRPLLFASAAEDAGRSFAREGRVQDAIALLSEALDSYLEHEATADARRVGRLLREHGVRHCIPSSRRPASGWGSLTDSELRVVRLVADGATNREAALRLFLSPHTVSSHLRHAFAKLGINSRVELARVVFEADPGATGRPRA